MRNLVNTTLSQKYGDPWLKVSIYGSVLKCSLYTPVELLLICSALISSNKHSYVKPFHFSFYDICNFSPFTLLTKAVHNGAKLNMKSHSILYTYAISRDFFFETFPIYHMDLLSVNQARIYLLRIWTTPYGNLEMRRLFQIFRLIFFSLF